MDEKVTPIASYPVGNPPRANPMGAFYTLEEHDWVSSTLDPLEGIQDTLYEIFVRLTEADEEGFYGVEAKVKETLRESLRLIVTPVGSLRKHKANDKLEPVTNLFTSWLRFVAKSSPSHEEQNELLSTYIEELVAEFKRIQGNLSEAHYLLEEWEDELRNAMVDAGLEFAQEETLLEKSFNRGRNDLMRDELSTEHLDACLKGVREVIEAILASEHPKVAKKLLKGFEDREAVLYRLVLLG